ncbi:hypothetical protein VTK73DRAFT_1892 [Phialemonium thermophilum]|uniref:Uncharacterized protein n=1 Tax=Phialemonium thermophilum TaxID=223376 RepID=A0ABR3Y2M8_9PEZI
MRRGYCKSEVACPEEIQLQYTDTHKYRNQRFTFCSGGKVLLGYARRQISEIGGQYLRKQQITGGSHNSVKVYFFIVTKPKSLLVFRPTIVKFLLYLPFWPKTSSSGSRL